MRREGLDHLLILGESHLDRVVKDAQGVEFFNQVRPHQGIEQKIQEGIHGEENEP